MIWMLASCFCFRDESPSTWPTMVKKAHTLAVPLLWTQMISSSVNTEKPVSELPSFPQFVFRATTLQVFGWLIMLILPSRCADVPWFSSGFVHGSVLRQRRWSGQRPTDACSLRLQRAKLCHHFLSPCHSDPPGWVIHLCLIILPVWRYKCAPINTRLFQLLELHMQSSEKTWTEPSSVTLEMEQPAKGTHTPASTSLPPSSAHWYSSVVTTATLSPPPPTSNTGGTASVRSSHVGIFSIWLQILSCSNENMSQSPPNEQLLEAQVMVCCLSALMATMCLLCTMQRKRLVAGLWLRTSPSSLRRWLTGNVKIWTY